MVSSRESDVSPAKPIKVLIVEDDETSAGLITAVMQRAGFYVHPYVSSIAEAISIVLGGDVDVVVLDLTLHGSHASETLEAIPAFTTHAPVVVISGSDDAEIVAAAMRLGAKDYIVKSLTSVERLERAVRDAHQEKTEAQSMASATTTALPLDETPPKGVSLFDAHGKLIRKTQRPESDRTAATIIVGGKKYKLSNRMAGWLRKALPYALAVVVGGGGVHGVRTLADKEKEPIPKEQIQSQTGPLLADHDARLSRIEEAFRDHVQEERKTLMQVNETMNRTNAKLDEVTKYLLEHK